MSDSCCPTPTDRSSDLRYRRILYVALLINAGMFLFELIAGASAGSSALQADALDFLADAGNYGISLFVLGAMQERRATAALIKGLSMGAFGVGVVGQTIYYLATQTLPAAKVMGVVGVIALAANFGVAALLYSYRQGDSNMRSVWICTRNDVIGNVAVMLAASGVFVTGRGWPDIVVALGMAALALSGATQTVRHALEELRQARTTHSPI